MSKYCDSRGEYVDQDQCEECDYVGCAWHPEHEATLRKEMLDKFRSSAFASDIKQRLQVVFPIDEDAMCRRLDELFKAMTSDVDHIIHDVVRDALRQRAVSELDRKLKAELETIYEKSVEERLVLVKDGSDPCLQSIREQAISKINRFIANQGKGRRENDTIQLTIEKLVGERVDTAVEEIKREAIDKFNKDAMKTMMRGMAKAIGEDARLLRLLTE